MLRFRLPRKAVLGSFGGTRLFVVEGRIAGGIRFVAGHIAQGVGIAAGLSFARQAILGSCNLGRAGVDGRLVYGGVGANLGTSGDAKRIGPALCDTDYAKKSAA